MPKTHPYATEQEIAESLAMSIDEVRAIIKSGDLKATIIDSQTMISRADYYCFLMLRCKWSGRQNWLKN